MEARRDSLWWCALQDTDERVTVTAEMLRHHSSRWNVVTDAESRNESRLSTMNSPTHVHVSYLCY